MLIAECFLILQAKENKGQTSAGVIPTEGKMLHPGWAPFLGSVQVPQRSRLVVSLPATVADVGLPLGLPRNISRTNLKTSSSAYEGLKPREIIFPITLSRLFRAIMISNM